MTIRKNFNFDEEIVKHLEKRAKEENKTQTQLLEELIAKDRKEERRKKRLKALESLAGSAPSGSLVDVNIRQIRIDKALKYAN